MSEDRPVERIRARRGLGARSRHGETTPADRRGRLKHLGNPVPEGGRGGRTAQASRAEHARRRTVRDNPEGNA